MKKIIALVFIFVLPLLLMMMSSVMAIFSSNQNESSESVENYCSYDTEIKFQDREVEEQRIIAEKFIVDDKYQNVVLAIYSMDKRELVKDIALKVNKMIEYTKANKINKNYESFIQAYIFGNNYFDFLNDKGMDTNLQIAQEYQNENDLESDSYKYSTIALANLKTDCSFNDSGYPVKEPYMISGWYPTYDKDGSGDVHVGIDFGVPLETPMYAIKDSEVISIGTGCPVKGKLGNTCGENGITGAGNYVMLKFVEKNDTYYISYMHLTKPIVSIGDTVLKGQLVGYSGSSGNSSGPHCHFEIHKNPKSITDIGVKSKTHLNPCEYIKGLCK